MAIGKDGRKLVGRREAAARLGITYDRFRYLERSRVVAGRKIKDAWFFDPHDLDAVRDTVHRLKADSREGEAAAAAYELFRAGSSNADVVIGLKMAPARVAELRASYDPSALVLSGELVAELVAAFRRAGLGFDGPRELVAEVSALLLEHLQLVELRLERHAQLSRRARGRGPRDTLPAPASH